MPVMAPIAGDSPQAISRGDIRRRNPSPSGITELLLLQEHWLHSPYTPEESMAALKNYYRNYGHFYGSLRIQGCFQLDRKLVFPNFYGTESGSDCRNDGELPEWSLMETVHESSRCHEGTGKIKCHPVIILSTNE